MTKEYYWKVTFFVTTFINNGFEDETCVGSVGGAEYGGGGVDVSVEREKYGGEFEMLYDLFNELTGIFPLKIWKS